MKKIYVVPWFCGKILSLDSCRTLKVWQIPYNITYTTRGNGIWHIYHERNSYPAEGDMSFFHGIWDHIPLVIVASDSLRI